MCLVGAFVLRETQVAVDSIKTFFCIGMAYRRVQRAQFVDDLCSEVDKFSVNGIVAAFVVHKPFPIVVDCQFGEKSKYVR